MREIKTFFCNPGTEDLGVQTGVFSCQLNLEEFVFRVPRARGDSRALLGDSWQRKAEEITCASQPRGVGMFVCQA